MQYVVKYVHICKSGKSSSRLLCVWVRNHLNCHIKIFLPLKLKSHGL